MKTTRFPNQFAGDGDQWEDLTTTLDKSIILTMSKIIIFLKTLGRARFFTRSFFRVRVELLRIAKSFAPDPAVLLVFGT